MDLVLLAIVFYLVGSIPFGVIAARLRGIDLLSSGSRSTGATNVLRTAGVGPAVVAGLLDVGKGALAVYVGERLGGAWGGVVAGLGAVAGHCWSAFLRFRGGKAVATSAGAALLIAPLAVGVGVAVFAAMVGLTGYVSLGSITGTAVAALLIGLTHPDHPPHLLFGLAVLALVVYRHRPNIARLLIGQENRFGRARKGGGSEGRR